MELKYCFFCKDPLIDLKCSNSDNNLFYTGTSKEIQICDLRTKSKTVEKFELNENNSNGHKPKPFTTFDVNKDDRYITAGTEVVDHDAFVLFWDARNPTKFLGGTVVIRSEFKFPANIEITFSQILLAIR